MTFATMARLRLRTITNLKATLRGDSLRFGREKPRDLYLATMRGNNPAPRPSPASAFAVGSTQICGVCSGHGRF